MVELRHFRRPSKHDAQASENFASKHTRSRVVLVSSTIGGNLALSKKAAVR
jgi:hypothetical protein